MDLEKELKEKYEEILPNFYSSMGRSLPEMKYLGKKIPSKKIEGGIAEVEAQVNCTGGVGTFYLNNPNFGIEITSKNLEEIRKRESKRLAGKVAAESSSLLYMLSFLDFGISWRKLSSLMFNESRDFHEWMGYQSYKR